MMSLSDDMQVDIIDAFNTTARYLDDILNNNNVYFDNMVSQMYLSELKLNKATSDTEAALSDLHLSISNIVSTKIYDKHDDFDALWSPAGKGLTSWLSFVMSNCEIVTFPLVSWVRCGA